MRLGEITGPASKTFIFAAISSGPPQTPYQMSAEAQAVGAGAVGAGAVGATDAASSVGAVPTVAAGAGSPVLGDHRVTLDSSERTEKKLPLERCVLEQFTRCSESHLWKLMMSFYDRKGIDSWSQGVVPHFITCNSFIGRAYARVLQGFLRDCASKGKCLDPTQPLYVIELGVGSGNFSYYMLKALLEMAATLDFPVGKIVYVMTDFTDANVGFWRNHPQLRAFFESGQMECAIFDAVRDTSITLSVSGFVLETGSVVNPLCIVERGLAVIGRRAFSHRLYRRARTRCSRTGMGPALQAQARNLSSDGTPGAAPLPVPTRAVCRRPEEQGQRGGMMVNPAFEHQELKSSTSKTKTETALK